MNEQDIRDDGDPKRYFAQIPNIVLKLGLKPYALSLYMHIKQIASEDGRCTKSTPTLAKETGMGAGSISRAKDELSKPFALLGGKSLINITEEASHGGKPRHIVTVVDIWPENMTHFASTRSTGEKRISRGEIQRSSMEIQISTGEIKKNPLKNNQDKKKPTPSGVGRKRQPRTGNSESGATDPSKLYRSIRSYSPNETQRKEIAAAVTDLERWREVLTQLEREGQPKHHVDWALERYNGNAPQRTGPRRIGEDWSGESQVDAPASQWKAKPYTREDFITTLMDVEGWTQEFAESEWERRKRGTDTGATKAA